MTTTALPRRPLRSKNIPVIIAASIGNALEWFDFVVFGFFAATIAELFFPSASQTLSLLLTFGTFAVTFFMRPLGALVLGLVADRYGRRDALAATIALMMLGTAMIAVLPTYATIGILAPLLIVLARLIQGFSAGGEFGCATTFLAEHNPKHRGFYASWQFASQGLTTVMATAFGAFLAPLLSTAQMEAWGWRIPFFFGLIIGPVAYYIRRHLDETTEFQAIEASVAPLRDLLGDAKQRLAVALGVTVLGTVATYTVLFMPTYASRQLGLPISDSFLAVLLTGTIQAVLVPIVGIWSDRLGRIPIAAASAVLMLLVAYPAFAWLVVAPHLTTLLLVQAGLGVLIAGYTGGLPALMSELFPVQIRTIGVSISYAFAVAIFGGFAPFIDVWMISVTGSNLAPSFYLMLACIISLSALVTVQFRPHLIHR